MNLKLKRTARTPYSEEIVIYDADTRDDNDDAVNLGKLDVHYLGDQIVGTLLIWQEYATGFSRLHGPGSDVTLDTLIDEILAEISEPLGVPAEYGIEVYYPSAANQSFASNYADEGEATQEETFDDEEAYSEEETERDADTSYPPREDDFAKKLQSRP
jgi:hypothetical protein